MVRPDDFPTLTTAEVDALLDIARRQDVYGALPSDNEWSPTWDLNSAAAYGWTWKAGAVAAHFPFSTDGQSFNRDVVYQQCLEQARVYAAKVSGSISVASDSCVDGVVIN